MSQAQAYKDLVRTIEAVCFDGDEAAEPKAIRLADVIWNAVSAQVAATLPPAQ